MSKMKGPFIYENWKASVGAPATEAMFEFPLFTDAYVAGEITEGLGPYQVLNGFSLPYGGEMVAGAVLRLAVYGEDDATVEGMKKTYVRRYHGGWINEEVAALLSLSFGFRLKSGGISRRYDLGHDPLGRPCGPAAKENPVLLKPQGCRPVVPYASGNHAITATELLRRLPDLSPENAVALVKSARRYQDGLWIAEFQPEQAWLMFVSAIEVAAEEWCRESASPTERLELLRPELFCRLKDEGGEALAEYVAEQIVDSMGSTKKFADFLLQFKPGPPSTRPARSVQVPWDDAHLGYCFKKIYGWRSRALHGGIPFPRPMCEAPQLLGQAYNEEPLGIATATRGGVWRTKDAPMLLHIFEYIVRKALLAWWASMIPESV